MENLLIVFAMRMLTVTAKDSRLLHLIAASCALFELMYYANIDISLYYSANAMISAFVGLIALRYIKTLSARLFSVFMLMQCVLCLLLVWDWSYSVNDFLQYNLTQYNDILIIMLIAIGAVSSSDYDRYSNN